MKIMVINPNSSQHMTKHLEEALVPIAAPGTELTVVCPPDGPYSISSAYDEAMCAAGTLELVKRANEENYDAVILACFSDPALEAAKEISRILVMGIAETSLHVAAMMGFKYTILTLTDERIPHKFNDARRFKLENSLASIRALGMSVAETDEDPERAKAQIKRIARLAAEEDRSEVIVLGCAGMAGYAEEIEREVGVVVIDPSSVTLKVAEALVAAGVHVSKRGLYAFPPSAEG